VEGSSQITNIYCTGCNIKWSGSKLGNICDYGLKFWMGHGEHRRYILVHTVMLQAR
jgi:hypothetical protein